MEQIKFTEEQQQAYDALNAAQVVWAAANERFLAAMGWSHSEAKSDGEGH